MTDVLVIQGWNDMHRFGIGILTGEACGLGMRLLCDLSEKGKRLLEEFLGGCASFTEGSNWNSNVDNEPAVASALLAYSSWRELAAFCLLKEGYEVAAINVTRWSGEAGVAGFRLDGQSLDDVMKEHDIHRAANFRTFQVTGTAGTRNTHVWTGRTT